MSLWRRVIVVATGLCAATGITSVPATAAPTGDASTMALVQLTFTSVSNGHRLDVASSGQFGNVTVVAKPAPGTAQTWRINTGAAESSVAIVNTTANKCLDVGFQALQPVTCDGRASQKWYFQPVEGSAQKAFMVRHEADNYCLGLATDPFGNEVVGLVECSGAPTQQWVIPTDAYQVAWNTAVDHAAARCIKDTSTCSWDTGNQSPPILLPATCVSPVWFNGTSTAIPWTFSLTTSTGWTNTIGFSLQTQLQIGGGDLIPFQLQITAAVHGETSLNLKTDLGNSLVVTVPPRQYGWVALSELATRVTGKWTFDTQGLPWTAEDTITVPLKHDPAGGASIYSARTSPTFTSCDATS